MYGSAALLLPMCLVCGILGAKVPFIVADMSMPSQHDSCLCNLPWYAC